MATKKFVMEIPLILHDMVQEFVVSALSARPSNYVDFAVEYYLRLQVKEDRVLYETVGVESDFTSPGGDSDEVCGNGEVVSDTSNVYQVSINPEAFHSPPSKHFPSDDEDSLLTDLPCSDQPVTTSTNSIAILNQQESPLTKLDNTTVPINSSHTLPTSPLTFSFQGTSFNVTSSTNSMSILPITSPIVNGSTPDIPFNLSLALTSSSQLNTLNNRPTSPLVSTTFNSPVSLRVIGDGSPHSSPFTPSLKNNNLSLTGGEFMQHKVNQNHFQCKSCRGVFKPHPRPSTQDLLSVPNSPVTPGNSLSNQSFRDRPQVYSLLPASHIHPAEAFSSTNSPPNYYTTTNQQTPISKSMPDLTERKFHCPICERSYKSNTGLKRHLIVHSGERPFQCHYCFKSFYRKYVLTTHIARVHNKQIAATQS